MIDVELRAVAIRISNGECASLPLAHNRGVRKAHTYGVVANALSMLVLPTTAEVLGSRDFCSVSGVSGAMVEVLKERCDELLADNPEVQDRLGRAAHMRNIDLHGLSSADPARNALHGGINTAMDIEAATLATAHERTNAGELFARRGLYKSQRVPFAFAMQALANLDTSHERLFQRAWIPDAGDMRSITHEKILRPEVVSMDPLQGLMLVSRLPENPTPLKKYDGELAIGCPATLIKHFVRDLHIVLAQSCIESGIIPVSEDMR